MLVDSILFTLFCILYFTLSILTIDIWASGLLDSKLKCDHYVVFYVMHAVHSAYVTKISMSVYDSKKKVAPPGLLQIVYVKFVIRSVSRRYMLSPANPVELVFRGINLERISVQRCVDQVRRTYRCTNCRGNIEFTYLEKLPT